MLKRLLASIAILLLGATAALAADAAERRIIGFSPDGKWFAFEQFGVQDGSGFPYHDVFVVDLVTDTWANGTPVRVRIDDETATPLDARNQARPKAAAVLAKLKIIDQGRLMASNPVPETVDDPHSVTFRTHHNLSGPEHQVTVRMQHIPLPGEPHCESLVPDTKGFALTISKGGGPATEFYRDTRLPKSRGCAGRYAIADVVAPAERRDIGYYVVLVHVYSFGFEGFDTRFIAVPMRAP